MLVSLRGCGKKFYRLTVDHFEDGGTFYKLESGTDYPTRETVLAFSITRQGYLIGDGRDLRTAARALALTKNWC